MQKLVREFVARTAQEKKKTEGEQLERLSYIDTERHASEEGQGASSASVDVRLFSSP